MKKQLLMLGLGLLGSVTMSAQLTSPFTGTQPVAEVDATADYYLYNVKSGKCRTTTITSQRFRMTNRAGQHAVNSEQEVWTGV